MSKPFAGVVREMSRVHAIVSKLAEHREVVADEQGQVPIGWLLPFRSELQLLLQDQTVHRRLVLELMLDESESHVRPLLIWLLGRTGTRFCLGGIQAFVDSDDPATRKQVARSMRRLEASTHLQRMIELWPHDEWVQRFAREVRQSPYEERLQRFVTNNVDDARAADGAGPSRMPFWAFERSWYFSPPKSPAVIRRLLQQIQRWVRGSCNPSAGKSL